MVILCVVPCFPIRICLLLLHGLIAGPVFDGQRLKACSFPCHLSWTFFCQLTTLDVILQVLAQLHKHVIPLLSNPILLR